MTTSRVPLAIEACGLVNSFGAVRAVDGLDLAVPSGGVFALLGPNGAGKTSTIRIFATLAKPDAGGRPARTYSGGMRRRLDIAVSLVVAPALLFLDEPTTGLDPYSRIQVWGAVRWLVTRGTTVR